MPHDRLRFAWIPPPRAVRLPRRCMRQERQPNEKEAGTNAQPLCDHVGYRAHKRLGTENKLLTWGQNGNPGQGNARPAWESLPAPHPCWPKKEAARLPRRERGPPAHWLPGVEEFTSSFFFRWPPPKLKRLRYGLKSSGFHPQMACIPSGSPA